MNNKNSESANASTNQIFDYEQLKKYKRKMEEKTHMRNEELKRFNELNLDKLSDVDQKKLIALLSRKDNYLSSAILYNILIVKIASSQNDALKAKAQPFAKKNGIEILFKSSLKS